MIRAKTCEEYVLNELAEARKEAEAGKELILSLANTARYTFELLEILKKGAEIHTLENGAKVISFKPVFERFNEDEYELWEDYLTGEDEEDGENED